MIGKKLVHYEVIDSTNDEARRMVKQGEGEGLVVTAGSQTAGRGKPGARWFSPPGNLYLSAVVKPRRDQKDIAPLTITAALAARTAIVRETELPVVIKWPNDILVRGKKAGGILTERLPSGHVIIGIGINLTQHPASAAALDEEAGRPIDLKHFTDRLLLELEKEYLAYLAEF